MRRKNGSDRLIICLVKLSRKRLRPPLMRTNPAPRNSVLERAILGSSPSHGARAVCRVRFVQAGDTLTRSRLLRPADFTPLEIYGPHPECKVFCVFRFISFGHDSSGNTKGRHTRVTDDRVGCGNLYGLSVKHTASDHDEVRTLPFLNKCPAGLPAI